jgi:hypothetical protein
MNRRDFLVGSAALAAGLGASSRGLAQGRSRQQGPFPASASRVAIMSYSFERILKGRTEGPDKVLDLLDLPQMYADHYGVHNVEVQHAHFVTTEPSYFRLFRQRVEKARSRVTNVNLEFGAMNISADDPVMRAQAVDLTKQWLDHAALLGSPRLMVNQGPLTRQSKPLAVDTLKRMTAYAKTKGIKVAMENRGGGRPAVVPPPAPGAPPAPPPPPAPAVPITDWIDLLAELIQESGAYANCDMGNFPDQEQQHYGIRKLFPLTDGNAHVKLNPARYDLPAAVALTRQLGYTGLYSIEANPGPTVDPYQFVQQIYDVLTSSIERA